MAQNIKTPEHFNFQKPEEFEQWIKRFDRYLLAANITNAVRKVNTLLYCLGAKADDVLSTFGLTAQQMNDYDVVSQRFTEYFCVRRNVIFERARFNRRMQSRGESIEEFILDLYRLIGTCDYGDRSDEFLRDKIVVGIADIELSEKLQADDQLTLARAKELIAKQSTLLRASETVAQADAVRSGNRPRSRNQSQAKRSDTRTKHKACSRCGKSSHPIKECPARDSTCGKCQRKGHWQNFAGSG